MEKPTTTEQFQQDQRFDWRFLRNKIEVVTHALDGTQPATAGNYGVFSHVPFACWVEEVWESHQIAGTDAGAVTVDLEKLTSGQALDAGTTMFAAAQSLKSTINTPVNVALTATIASRQLARGDRLALKDGGVLTAVAGLAVTVVLHLKI